MEKLTVVEEISADLCKVVKGWARQVLRSLTAERASSCSIPGSAGWKERAHRLTSDPDACAVAEAHARAHMHTHTQISKQMLLFTLLIPSTFHTHC